MSGNTKSLIRMLLMLNPNKRLAASDVLDVLKNNIMRSWYVIILYAGQNVFLLLPNPTAAGTTIAAAAATTTTTNY